MAGVRLRRLQSNPYLLFGLTIMVALMLFGFVGPLLVTPEDSNVGAYVPKLP
ncbi:MAG: hypothetical protein ACK2UI_08145, partial [Anaerolineae bacterium]